jgi:hypothetical protein
VLIVLHLLDEMLEGERVGSLDGEAETSAPDLGGHDTEGSGDTEEDSVVVKLVEAVVHQESTGAGVNVGPRVADLACGLKHVGDDLVASLHEVHKVVVLGDVLIGELELAHEARISLAENGVTVPGHDFAAGEGVLDVSPNVVLSPLVAKAILEVKKELEALLVGKAVQGTSEAVHTSREGQVRVGQGAADEVSSVSAHVATLVITKFPIK